MYSGLPTRSRRTIKTTLSLAWLLVGAGGFVTIFIPYAFFREGMSVFGATLALASVVAALGVALGQYRWEWIAAWVAGMMLSPSVVTTWALVIGEGQPLLERAFFLTSLFVFLVLRAELCAAHAEKLREVHGMGTTAIEVIEREGDDGVERGSPGCD